ncbi:MAG: hypothetical protein Q7S76_04350 [bacterium]|nr:hypothetical protein [bacterium]
MQFFSDPNVSEEPIIADAILRFDGILPVVTFTGDAASLKPDVQSVLEHVALRLFEHSCIPSHSEVLTIEDADGGDGEGEKPMVDLSGGIVHIGAKKGDGRPGSYTPYADIAFQKMLQSLGVGRPRIAGHGNDPLTWEPGISLRGVNDHHRATHPECQHNLTYRRPSQAEVPSTIPVVQRAPSELL